MDEHAFKKVCLTRTNFDLKSAAKDPKFEEKNPSSYEKLRLKNNIMQIFFMPYRDLYEIFFKKGPKF